MTLQVKLEIWADQPAPEVHTLNDRIEVVQDDPVLVDIIRAEAVDTAAPVPGGHPPDKIREMHGLPIAQPMRGPRDAGAQIVTSDQYALDGREVEDLPGLKISRTGSGQIDGLPTSTNATVAKIDQGPAGLRAGKMDRDAWHFGSKK